MRSVVPVCAFESDALGCLFGRVTVPVRWLFKTLEVIMSLPALACLLFLRLPIVPDTYHHLLLLTARLVTRERHGIPAF